MPIGLIRAPSACRGGPRFLSGAARRPPAFVINPTIRWIAFESSTAMGTLDASQSRLSNSYSAGESDQSILLAVMLQPRCFALGVLRSKCILSEQRA